ncbi:hypothetical protein P9112_002707 [Eukaryota sp. TZLM1-RC]
MLCPVCKINQIGFSLPCGHCFCNCAIQWVNSHHQCPMCRSPSTTHDIRRLYLDDTAEDVEADQPQLPEINFSQSPRISYETPYHWIPLPAQLNLICLDALKEGRSSTEITYEDDCHLVDFSLLKMTNMQTFRQFNIKFFYNYPSNVDWLFRHFRGYSLCNQELSIQLEQNFVDGVSHFEFDAGIFTYRITLDYERGQHCQENLSTGRTRQLKREVLDEVEQDEVEQDEDSGS